MRTYSGREGQRQSGQSLVEFALILPLLIAFALTALDMGRVFYYDVQFESGLREAARYAAKTSGASTGVLQAIIQQEGNLPAGSVSNVLVVLWSGSTGGESIEKVTATYNFTFISPWFQTSYGIANPLSIRTSVTAEVDHA